MCVMYIWFMVKISTITSSYGLLTMNLIFIGCEYPLFSVLNRGTSDARKLLLGWYREAFIWWALSLYIYQKCSFATYKVRPPR